MLKASLSYLCMLFLVSADLFRNKHFQQSLSAKSSVRALDQPILGPKFGPIPNAKKYFFPQFQTKNSQFDKKKNFFFFFFLVLHLYFIENNNTCFFLSLFS